MAYLVPIFFSNDEPSNWDCWNCGRNNHWLSEECARCNAPMKLKDVWEWLKVKVLKQNPYIIDGE